MPTDNYVLLEKVVVGAATASSVVFNSIPQTYTDLVVKVSARSTSSTGTPWIYVSLNGSGSGFTFQNVNSDGATTYAGTTVFAVNQSNSQTANTFGSAEFYLSNYTSSKYKTISVDSMQENNSTTASMFAGSAMWANTAAITSITFQTDGNYAQHSSFSLYGISKSGVLPSTAPKAIGGNTIMNDGSYWYHAFTTSGTFTPIDLMTADILVVAGGGGGAGSAQFWGGGGGGAGGVIAHSAQGLSATNYTVTIGAGGAGAPTSNLDGMTSGSNSQFGSLTAALFGTVGGSLNGPGGFGACGSSGGSIGNYTTGWWVPTAGQGFRGGYSSISGHSAGGGGGAGAVGANSTTDQSGGAGGAGVNTYSAWLSATGLGVSGYIAGGGGGGSSPAYGTVVQALGGAGGGGNGGTVASTGVTSATANTGSGGGGAAGTHPSAAPPSGAGGNGGSGLVIVRYPV